MRRTKFVELILNLTFRNMPGEKSFKFQNEYMFEPTYIMNEIRIDLIGYCYLERFVFPHT